MQKIFIYFFILTFRSFAQSNYGYPESNINSSFINFLPESNDIVCILELKDTTFNYSKSNKNIITVFSHINGNIIKQIPLSAKDKYVYAFNVSHDGNSLIVFTSVEYRFDDYQRGPFIIKKYSLKENKWEWEKEWYSELICIRMTFSSDNKQIICITPQSILTINSQTGLLIKKSNSISSIIDADAKYPRFELSKNGRYFAYWKAKYFTFSANDDAGCLFGIDLIWYVVRWLFCLGSIPQYLYIWDIEKDNLYDQIRTPFNSNKGTPSFTSDENELLLGPYDGEYLIYSIDKKNIIKTFSQKESDYSNSILSERNVVMDTDYKNISPNNKYFAACFELNRIYLIDYNTGKLNKEIRQSIIGGSYGYFDQYALSFSLDSKYFSAITYKNSLCMYSTETWELMWERDDLYKWHQAK